MVYRNEEAMKTYLNKAITITFNTLFKEFQTM